MPGVDQDYKERAVPKLTGELPAERFDTIMSVRLQIATAAMQGLVAHYGFVTAPDAALQAFEVADAMIRHEEDEREDKESCD